ncbi:MAG: ATP-binding cassette domain-containing protein, partial [Clostridia bacterium]|nr:ATP-binding cassette domain-containing protein [Clostridia bacterium]
MDEMIIMTPEGRIANKEPETRTPVVSVRHLHFSYGARLVLKDIDFDLYPGEIFGFLGPNGSGKTTTIKLMLGLLPINSGRITICGKDVGNEFEAALANVGGIVENPEMYSYLTGRQNLELFRRMFDSVEKER